MLGSMCEGRFARQTLFSQLNLPKKNRPRISILSEPYLPGPIISDVDMSRTGGGVPWLQDASQVGRLPSISPGLSPCSDEPCLGLKLADTLSGQVEVRSNLVQGHGGR